MCNVARANLSPTNRGDAAAATWIVRGDESRRRRGRDVDIRWRRVALRRGSSVETRSPRRGRGVAALHGISARHLAAVPRPVGGKSTRRPPQTSPQVLAIPALQISQVHENPPGQVSRLRQFDGAVRRLSGVSQTLRKVGLGEKHAPLLQPVEHASALLGDGERQNDRNEPSRHGARAARADVSATPRASRDAVAAPPRPTATCPATPRGARATRRKYAGGDAVPSLTVASANLDSLGVVGLVEHYEASACLLLYFRCADIPWTGRDHAAAVTWIIRGRHVGAAPQLRRGYSVGDTSGPRRSCDVDIPWETRRGHDVDIPWEARPRRGCDVDIP